MIYKFIVNTILFYGMLLKLFSFALNELSTYILGKLDTTFESTMKDIVHSKTEGRRRAREEDELDATFSETGSVNQSVMSDMRFARRK